MIVCRCRMTGHNDCSGLIARKIILKINTTGHFHDAKINKTTPTQLDVIRLYCCWFTNLKNGKKDVTGCYQSRFYYFIFASIRHQATTDY